MSYFPYLPRNTFLCSVTKLQTSLECSRAQNEFALTTPANQPSFVSPNVNPLRMFLFQLGHWTWNPSLSEKNEKNQTIKVKKLLFLYPHCNTLLLQNKPKSKQGLLTGLWDLLLERAGTTESTSRIHRNMQPVLVIFLQNGSIYDFTEKVQVKVHSAPL